MTHRIRLRTAWNRQLDQRPVERVELPETQLPSDASAANYCRSFNCPSGLDEHTRVDLVVERWQGRLTLYLDDAQLVTDRPSSDAPLVCDITELLRGSHRLRLRLDSHSGAAVGLTGIVALEIRVPEDTT